MRTAIARRSFSSEKEGRSLRLAVKIIGGVLFMGFNVGMLYYWWSQEEAGRKRAQDYFAKHGPRKKKAPLIPDELQPEYVQQQRHKFQRIVRQKAREQQATPPQ